MRIAIIGGGNIGGAIAEGAVKKGIVEARDVVVADPQPTIAKRLERNEINIGYTTDNVKAIRGADIVLLAVKPWLGEEVLREISGELDRKRQVVVSVMHGVTFEKMNEYLSTGELGPIGLYSVVPNTAISLGRSMTFIAKQNTDAVQDGLVEMLFWALGHVFRIEERDVDAASALASSGIAYILRYIDAAAAGGEQMGIDRKKAQAIVVKTIQGALALLDASGNTPQAEINRVTTPGGVTLKGLDAMEKSGFTEAVIQGLLATK